MRRLVAVPLVFALMTGVAWAYWTAGSVPGGNGASAATSVNQGATPTANASGAAVTVSWAATTLASGQAVTGYVAKRYDAVTPYALQTILSSCAGTIATTSCVENLALDNPNDRDLVVDRSTVTVTDVDAPTADADHPCRVADFDVRQVAGHIAVTLRANRQDDLSGMGVARGDWPAVGMLDRPVNQDGCKGAFLTLGHEASGVDVQR